MSNENETRNKSAPRLSEHRGRSWRPIKTLSLMALSAMLSVALSGCLAVGYSSGGGWFIWPGGLGLLFIVLLVLFLLRRRR